MDDNHQYRELFFEETDEHLGQLNDGVLELESDPHNRDLLDKIFRSAHTLKGMAATMGYNTMAKLTHSMENMFQGFKDQTLQVDGDSISLIFACLDKLEAIVEGLRVETEPDESTIRDLLTRLTAITSDGGQASKVENTKVLSLRDVHQYLQSVSPGDLELCQQALAEEYHAYGIGVQLESSCVLKGPRVFLVMDKLEREGEVLHSNPHAEALENGEFAETFYLLYLSKLTAEKVQKLVLSNSEIEQVIVKALTLTELEHPETLTGATNSPKETEPDSKAEEKTYGKKKTPDQGTGNHSIRVEVSKLDHFMDLVSELVVYRTRLETLGQEGAVTQLQEPLEQVARITSELQGLVLQIRMEQVSVVLKRFPRMVRDLARDLKKDINLVIEGEETELDRTVVSELSEPLIHLIRNSADHGIESPAKRVALGKPATGEIKITAAQHGDQVSLTISDDGKGLNPAVIAASAIKKGIPTEGLTDQELCHLIFHPGFSTAEAVTDVSGRGVGMDAVQAKIASIGGTIELMSQVNQGTTFIVNLPLTLSIIQSLMVKVSGEIFALPSGVIEKVVAVSPAELINVHGQEIYLDRGVALPVVRIKEELKLAEPTVSDAQHLVIVMIGKKQYGILVDELIGQQEVVIKQLGNELAQLTKYVGATILGNGDVVLILDLAVLCQESSGAGHDKL